MAGDVLGIIRAALPRLSAAETRVAQAVLDAPEKVLDLTITELAARCDSSQATIARFCQGLGYSGYRDFRLALASATSRERVARERFALSESEIDSADTATEVATKIAYQETVAIEQTARELDLDALDRVAELVLAAPRVDIYGVGSSSLTALDLHQKLTRIGLATFASPDIHLSMTSAALQRTGGVAIGVSHSGETLETLHALRIAGEAGATTVAVTNFPSSRIAEAADLVLATHARESLYRSGAMSSRIAQLTLVDILFVRIAQRIPERVSEALERTYEAVKVRRPARAQ